MKHNAAKPSFKGMKVLERMEMAKDLQEDFLRQIVRFPVLSDDAHRLHLNRPTVMPMNLRERFLISLLR
jgi:hypothetical protein